MPLPPQETFTLEEVAQELDRSVHYVEQLVRTLKFKYIIVKGEVIGGLPLTRHLYFDKHLWIKDYAEKVALDPASQEQEYEESVKSHQAYLEKTFEEGVKSHRADLEKERGAKYGATWEKEYRTKWEKEHGGKIKFNPTTLKKQLYKTFYNIDHNEVANLWQPISLSRQWQRPKENVVIHIPRATLEAVKKEYGIQDQSIGQNAKKKKPWNPSEINREEWYPTSGLAGYLGLKQKGLQNRLGEDKELRKTLGARKKRNGQWEFKGQGIIDYLKPHQDS